MGHRPVETPVCPGGVPDTWPGVPGIFLKFMCPFLSRIRFCSPLRYWEGKLSTGQKGSVQEGVGAKWNRFFLSGFFHGQVRTWYTLCASRHHQISDFLHVFHIFQQVSSGFSPGFNRFLFFRVCSKT